MPQDQKNIVYEVSHEDAETYGYMNDGAITLEELTKIINEKNEGDEHEHTA